MSKKDTRMWGGRFNEPTDEFVQAFTASVNFDRRLAAADIEGSLAHAKMLARIGVLDGEELQSIEQGLGQIGDEIDADRFAWSVALEDVHMNIEARLTELIGEAGKKLHTGRSRNDQVATDIRLYLRTQIAHVREGIRAFQSGLLDLAEREADAIMPGFTHLQVAQPVSFGHHVLAWFEMLERDHGRLGDCAARLNQLPLGSAALAGTSYKLDREYTAELLGFDAPCRNSIDAVSDRDFVIEFCAAAAICMTHLSRMAEELVLWSSAQFDFISLPDRYCTGSSIMPQKKNPDVAELVRGKSGRVSGHLVSLLMLMKSQPLAYNKDNQEDKEPLFDTLDTLIGSLRAFADMVPALEVKRERMYQAAEQGYATATDLADYLVRQGAAFRDAHEAVGNAVAFAIAEGKDLGACSLEELQRFDARIGEDVFEVLTLEGSLNARDHTGGTAPKQVRKQVRAGRKLIEE
ncbi:MAG TPA: argininosuccinate lyase [Gammaproteobacteria bacterium]|nr:argininosuccinate lyase [Gammaproteobacteria bacterium]